MNRRSIVHTLFQSVRSLSFEDLASLVVLLTLGIAGGMLLKATDVLLRIWGRDGGMSLIMFDVLPKLGLVYSFKFLWAPLLNKPLRWVPFMSVRRFWLLVSLVAIASALMVLSFLPVFSTPFLFVVGVLVLLQACFDMLVVASQVDAAAPHLRGLAESFCLNVYRVGMTIALSGSLLLSTWSISWPGIYRILSGLMLFQALMLLRSSFFKRLDQVPPAPLVPWKSSFLDPLLDLVRRSDSLFFIGVSVFYRMSEALWSANKELFFFSVGVTKSCYALLDVVNLWTSIGGVFVAGLFIKLFGSSKVMMAGGFVYLLVLLGLLWGNFCPFLPAIYSLCVLERLVFSVGLTAFFAFQTSFTSLRYALPQLAWMTALVNVSMRCVQMYAGHLYMVSSWTGVLGVSIVLQIPALALLLWRQKKKS